MREILFRGKRLDCGAWVYGSLVTYKDGAAFIYYPWLGDDTVVKRAVDPFTLGQYTGLKDKKGKRIFEGDTIHIPAHDFVGEVVYDDRFGKWNCCGAQIDNGFNLLRPTMSLSCAVEEGGEIVGNIHDNPELLEVE